MTPPKPPSLIVAIPTTPANTLPPDPKNIPDQATTDGLVAAQADAAKNAALLQKAVAGTNANNLAAVNAAGAAKNKKITAAAIGAGALALLLI